MPFAAQHIKAGRLHLQQADSVMKKIIKQVGPFTAKTRNDRFGALGRAIISQQISGRAAESILSRLKQLLGDKGMQAESLRVYDVEQLRAIGVSRQKATYLLDLAEKVHLGSVDLKSIGRLNDQHVIDQLTKIKGVGVWTAQMFLMFSLGRLDVFPDGDLGIQQAIEKHYLPGQSVDKQKMREIAKPWQPYSTIASWYLWRSLDTN